MNNNSETRERVVRSSKKLHGREGDKNGQSQMGTYEMIEKTLSENDPLW
jgi:hypothetical protein